MKRPWYLTGWLILIVIGALFSLYSDTLGVSSVKAQLPNIPSWYFTFLTAMIVVELVAVYLLWQWKMMGFYLFVAITAIVAVFNFMYLGAFSIVFGLVGLAILYLVMRPVWKNFK